MIALSVFARTQDCRASFPFASGSLAVPGRVAALEKQSSGCATQRYCSHANANACLCTLPAAGKVRSRQRSLFEMHPMCPRNPAILDDLDARGRICAAGTRLRALWGDFPVVVRVHSGACEKP